MLVSKSLIAASLATASAACTIPGTPPSNNIAQGFAIQVQNASYPVIHNRFMNQWSAGGGDQHLYLSPAGDAANDLTLVNGVITQQHGGQTIRAVINGQVRSKNADIFISGIANLQLQYTAFDNTTKMFMTQRGDPRAVYDVRYGCNVDTDQLQTELVFKERSGVLGGEICVRATDGNRHEFRYSPPGNTGTLQQHPTRS